MSKGLFCGLLTAVLAVIPAGCAPTANVPLNAGHMLPENRVMNHTRSAVFADIARPQDQQSSALSSQRTVQTTADSRPAPRDDDGVFVGLALSGGGSRSANFSAACMFQLERAGLLKHVDYISSVSGGSLTAAWYCASGPEWNPGEAQKKLTYSFASYLIGRSLMPWNQLAFFFTDYDRTDVLAGIFNENLFSRGGRPLTYRDLRPDRPRLLINATDLQSGRRFVFCNETFDAINSDLSRYPLAYAVAASAAVPVLLHPVTLRDYSTIFREYRHLIDGGVTDNLGVQTLVETYASQLDSAKAHGQPDPYPRGAVFVIIDAHTQFNAELSERSDIGMITSLKMSTGLTSTALLNRASSATLAEIIVNGAPENETAKEIRAQIKKLNDDGSLRLTDRNGHLVRVIYMALTQVNGLPGLPFNSFSESVNGIDTYFNISPNEAYNLYQAADLLMKHKFEPVVKGVVREIEGKNAE